MKVRVNTGHIYDGIRNDETQCPIALAIKETDPTIGEVAVNCNEILTDTGYFDCDPATSEWIIYYDIMRAYGAEHIDEITIELDKTNKTAKLLKIHGKEPSLC